MSVITLLLSLMAAVPPSVSYTGQAAFTSIFAATPALAFAAVVAFLAGEFVNSYILAKLKVWMGGKYLWVRTTGSTAGGQLVDNMVFCAVAYTLSDAFIGVNFWNVTITAAFACTMIEFVMTPVTYFVVRRLKQAERLDVYDTHTNFNPLKLS
jgi:uncharacterized integral membrane protein (TIGR00697 family)